MKEFLVTVELFRRATACSGLVLGRLLQFGGPFQLAANIGLLGFRLSPGPGPEVPKGSSGSRQAGRLAGRLQVLLNRSQEYLACKGGHKIVISLTVTVNR